MKGYWQIKVSGWNKDCRRKKHSEKDVKKDKAKLIRKEKFKESNDFCFVSGSTSMKDYKKIFRKAERQKEKEAISSENFDAALDKRNRKANPGELSNKPKHYSIY